MTWGERRGAGARERRWLLFGAALWCAALVALVGGAVAARAATWGTPLSWPSTSGIGSIQTVELGVDPLNGPTMLATNGNATQLLTSDLRDGAWTAWQPLGSTTSTETLPYQLAVGANGDMVAAWISCSSGESGCLLMASRRLSGAGWETPVTIYDPSTDTASGGPWTLPHNSNGDIALGIDGQGNATVAWYRQNPGLGDDVVTRSLMGDGTLTDLINIGYVNSPLVAASADGHTTIAWTGGTGTGAGAITAATADLGTATPVDIPIPTGDTLYGLSTDAAGHASVVAASPGFDDTSGVATVSEDSTYAWGSAIPIAGSEDPGVALQGGPWIAEDGAGNLSVMWALPDSGGSGNDGWLADLPAGQSTWSSPVAVADASHSIASNWDPMGINAAGDLVIAWNSPMTGSPGQDVVYARVRPAGGHFDAPTELVSDGNVAFNSPVIDANAVATVVYPSSFAPTGGYSISMIAPVTVSVTNPGSQTGTVGTAVRLQIQASDSDGGALTYSATGLPAGLSIDSASGLITGTPTAATPSGQPAQVVVTATDASGPHDSAAFAWTINPAASGGGTGGGSGGGGSGGGGTGGGGTGGGGSGGGYPLPSVTPSPGAPQPATCATSGKMPDFIGKVWDTSVTKLEFVRDLTVIERHPSRPPGGNRQVGEVYSQTPKAGTRIDPCTTHARIVIYGGPDGISVKDFNILKTLDGHELDTAQLPSGWNVTSYWFTPKAVRMPTIEKMTILSAKKHELRFQVAMPDTASTYYTASLDRTAPFNGSTNYLSADFPAPGTDGALSVDVGPQLFGAEVWTQAPGVPAHAKLIVDTHEVDDIENPADNLTFTQTTGTKQTTLADGSHVDATVLDDGSHFKVNPHKAGHIYVVACDPLKAQPCVPTGMESIPVIRRSSAFDALNGYRYFADGQYDGVASGVTGVKGAARDRATAVAADAGSWWAWFLSLFGIKSGSGQTATPTPAAEAKPGPPALTYFDGLNLQDVKPVTLTPDTGSPKSRLVYDFWTGLYPLLSAASTGLPPGQVYEYHGGRAVNLLNGKAYGIIAAGSANLQPDEVFGIIAAGSANIIGAGSANLIPGAPYLDADAYGLPPGTYRISRDAGGHVIATPIIAAGSGNIVAAGGANIIGAGGANIVAAGGANIVAAGGANLANGDYNIIAAGSGNIIGAGGANIVAAGSANFTGYQSLAAGLPMTWASAGPVMTMMNKGALVTTSFSQVGGYAAAGSLPFDVPSLTEPGKAVGPAGQIVAAGGANIVAAGGANIVAAGGANIVAAGGANIIAAGSGNIIGAGSAN